MGEGAGVMEADPSFTAAPYRKIGGLRWIPFSNKGLGKERSEMPSAPVSPGFQKQETLFCASSAHNPSAALGWARSWPSLMEAGSALAHSLVLK